MKFNPKVSEFFKDKPDLTLIGLWWALAWRFLVVYWAVVFALVAIGIVSSI